MNLLDEVDKIKKDGYSEANAEVKLCSGGSSTNISTYRGVKASRL